MQPPDPVPCLLLGQFATDISWAGRGIGTGLIKHTLERWVTVAALVGGRARLVNAMDTEAVAFWRRRGFVPSKDDSLVLFRSIAASLAQVILHSLHCVGIAPSSRNIGTGWGRSPSRPASARSSMKPSFR